MVMAARYAAHGQSIRAFEVILEFRFLRHDLTEWMEGEEALPSSGTLHANMIL